MNYLTGLILCSFAVLVLTTDSCRDLTDCQHVRCDDGFSLSCLDGLCICLKDGDGERCITIQDCISICLFVWKCVDLICQCIG